VIIADAVEMNRVKMNDILEKQNQTQDKNRSIHIIEELI